jgi:hypothetical protein
MFLEMLHVYEKVCTFDVELSRWTWVGKPLIKGLNSNIDNSIVIDELYCSTAYFLQHKRCNSLALLICHNSDLFDRHSSDLYCVF